MLKIMVRTHDCKVIKAAYINPKTVLPKLFRDAVETFVSAVTADYVEVRFKQGIIRVTDYDASESAIDAFRTAWDIATDNLVEPTLGNLIENTD